MQNKNKSDFLKYIDNKNMQVFANRQNFKELLLLNKRAHFQPEMLM